MGVIRNTFSNAAAPLDVKVPAEALVQLLLDVERCGASYPTAEKVEKVAPNTYKFTHEDRKVGHTHMKAVNINVYSRQGNTITWRAGAGGNLKSTGRFKVLPAGGNACKLVAETVSEADIDLPGVVLPFAQKIGDREIKKVFTAYLDALKTLAETNKVVRRDVSDVPVKHERFEKTRLDFDARHRDYQTVVKDYYQHVIDEYRQGWGDNWHFGLFRKPEDTLEDAIQRIERIVMEAAGITATSKAVDVGCGVGGPTCNIAKWSGCDMRGLNIDPNQVKVATQRARSLNLTNVKFDEGNFMAMPYPDNTFDAVTFFESVCHAPNKEKFFSECYRILKPGGRLSGLDWLQRHNPTKREYTQYIEPICAHHAVPSMGSVISYRKDMEKVGFHVPIAIDISYEGDILRNWELLDRDSMETFKRLQKEDPNKEHSTMEMMIAGGVALAEGARVGAFALGRFLGIKPKPGHGQYPLAAHL